MTDRRTELVAAGYDAMADTWEAWSTRVADDPRHAWLGRLVTLLPEGADVVELVADEVVTIREPEGPASFHWILARR